MPWIRIIALLLIVVCPAAGLAADDLDRAEALLAAGRFRQARELAARATTGSDPMQALRGRWIVAESYRFEGDYEEAMPRYAAISGDAPPRLAIEAALQLAQCRLDTWDAGGAEKALRKLRGFDLGPLSVRRDEVAAIAAYSSGRQKEARKLLEKLPHKSGAAQHYLGLIAFHSGEYAAGFAAFQHAVKAMPDDFYSQLYRATCLLELGRLKEARAGFLKALQIADIPEAHRLLGQLELRAERFEVAEKRFRTATRMAPADPEGWFGLATALRRGGKSKEAREVFAKFRKLHVAQQKALDRAYALDQQHLANPLAAQPAATLAVHHLATGEANSAAWMAWRALRIDPRHIEARLCLARALAELGKYADAATQYRKILRQKSDHPVATTELRRLLDRHARRVDD